MAMNANEVHIGPARIWLGVTLPATGDPPTKMAHTAGIPASGTEAGFTSGPVTFAKGQEITDVTAEQVSAPIISFQNTETVEVRFEALERNYQLLRAAFHNMTTVQDVDGIFVYGGGGSNQLRYQSVFFSSLRPSQAGKYEWGLVYRAFSVNGYEIGYSRTAGSTYAVVMRGSVDTTRDEGDQLFQYQIEA